MGFPFPTYSPLDLPQNTTLPPVAGTVIETTGPEGSRRIPATAAALGAAAKDLSNPEARRLMGNEGLWIMPAFRPLGIGSTQSSGLAFLGSGDGVRWFPLGAGMLKSASGGNLRDPSLHHNAATGAYYLCASDLTTNAGYPYYADHFTIYKSFDCVNWSFVCNVSPPGGGHTLVWSPRWFTDVDGQTHIVVSSSTDPAWSDFSPHELYIVTPTSEDMSTWGAWTMVFNGIAQPIDPALIRSPAGTYHLFYKNETSKYYEVATSATLKGSYVRADASVLAALQVWGNPIEGADVYLLSDGSFFATFEAYGAAPSTYRYSRSNSLTGGWSAPADFIGVPYYKHGSPFIARDPVHMKAALALTMNRATQDLWSRTKAISANYTIKPEEDNGTLFVVTTGAADVKISSGNFPIGFKFGVVKIDGGSGKVFFDDVFQPYNGAFNQLDYAQFTYDGTNVVVEMVPGPYTWRVDPFSKDLRASKPLRFNNASDTLFAKWAAANGKTGTITLDGTGTQVFANTSVTGNSMVFFAMRTPAGTPDRHPYASARTPGASFTVKSAAGDTSEYYFWIVEQH